MRAEPAGAFSGRRALDLTLVILDCGRGAREGESRHISRYPVVFQVLHEQVVREIPSHIQKTQSPGDGGKFVGTTYLRLVKISVEFHLAKRKTADRVAQQGEPV